MGVTFVLLESHSQLAHPKQMVSMHMKGDAQFMSIMDNYGVVHMENALHCRFNDIC